MKLPQLRRKVAVDQGQVRIDEGRIATWRREIAQLEAHSHPLPRSGVDYSFARPSPEALRRAGTTFVCRYLTGAGKALELAEAKALSAAGLDIVACYEGTPRAMELGESQGRQDAAAARHAAESLGIPKGAPIYFAADYEAPGGAAEQAYMRGVNAALGSAYQGACYGGLALVRGLLGAGYVRYAWQTLAWSGGVWDARCQLRQTEINRPVIDGAQCDTDWAYAADFGQWRLAA